MFRKLMVVFVAVITVAALAGCGSSTASKDAEAAGGAAASSQPEASPAPAKPSVPEFDDGTYMVGSEIQPGTYRTKNTSGNCYYSRLSGFGNTLDEIIMNDNANGPAIITIAATDKGFTSSRCGTWSQDLSPVTTNPASFDDGTFIVNTDIQPGTYKNSGGSGCYYARLSGFSGTLDDIISNDNTSGPAIVTIDATDVGFKSSRCGTWAKM